MNVRYLTTPLYSSFFCFRFYFFFFLFLRNRVDQTKKRKTELILKRQEKKSKERFLFWSTSNESNQKETHEPYIRPPGSKGFGLSGVQY